MTKGKIGCIAGFFIATLCIGLAVSIVFLIFSRTRPIIDASNEFLSLLGQGKISEAYESAADSLLLQQNEASFTEAVKQVGLTDYVSASWVNRRITNLEANASGTVIDKNGAKKPIHVHLIWDGSKWKVASVRYGGVDLATIQAIIPVPADTELERLSRESLSKLNQAILAKDFKSFYEGISNVWRKQTTPEQLQNTFQSLIDKGVDLGGIKNLKPEFDPPGSVDERGVLKVEGRYLTQPAPVQFRVEYFQDHGVWKLVGLWLTFDGAAAKGLKK